MLRDMQEEFAAARPGQMAKSHAAAYDRAIRLMQSEGGKVFDLTTEKNETRDKYGRNLFGQGCLLARRLVEKGVPFVEVTLGNWDTHGKNFDLVKNLCGTLDAAWGALMDDLKDRGLLDTTTIVWMGEFGRTPKINPQKGRDHYPNAWSTVLAGGGIKGGQAIGKTSKDGTTVEERHDDHARHARDALHGARHRLREDEPVERRPARSGSWTSRATRSRRSWRDALEHSSARPRRLFSAETVARRSANSEILRRQWGDGIRRAGIGGDAAIPQRRGRAPVRSSPRSTPIRAPRSLARCKARRDQVARSAGSRRLRAAPADSRAARDSVRREVGRRDVARHA